ncbi:nucleoside hydrolase [Caulobacter phage Seuss]|uniref:Nucleoside hydrolase n=1 Tax=Caulobacter phage Seuss TaxID=1675601 RepID=A0A0K1LM89_9CAUD|nr:nucleoside hydrolase [Caulobacter phage Seuss]AKU43579.1 nucleoside hydrolase [Caulobacter phage Seuss]
MTKVQFIGLAGRKRSGKNTAAEAGRAAGWLEMSFATPIKLMIGTLLAYQGVGEEVIQRMLHGDLKEQPTRFLGDKSPRQAMQLLGTEWGRDLMHPNLWANILVNAAWAEDFETVVVTDVRFPNEVDILRENGGSIFRIERPGLPKDDTHASEAGIDELLVDEVLINDAPSAEAWTEKVRKHFFD